jgi:hypothetical protein
MEANYKKVFSTSYEYIEKLSFSTSHVEKLVTIDDST